MLQHVAVMSPLGQMPNWVKGSERMVATASLAADQEVVIDPKSQVEIPEDAENKIIVLPTNESSENLVKIRHTVSEGY